MSDVLVAMAISLGASVISLMLGFLSLARWEFWMVAGFGVACWVLGLLTC